MTIDELRGAIANILGVEPAILSLSAKRDEIPQWDSIAAVSLVAFLDERVEGDLDSTEVEALDSFQSVIDFARRRGLLDD